MKYRMLLLALCLVINLVISVATYASDSSEFFSDESSRIGNNIFYYNPNDGGESNSNPCTSSSGTVASSDLGNVPDPWRSLIVSTASEYPTVDMRLVAATLWIENRGWPDYDRAEWAISSAGAKGPWQFIDSTWAIMGTDGDGDGRKDPNNPEDAVHAAFKHQIGSAGKPIIVGYDGDIESGLSLKFDRQGKSLLSYLSRYNGSGAPEGVALKDFPRGQNADYVMFGYYLLASDFTMKWKEGGGSESITGDGIINSTSSESCSSSEFGFVSTSGFAFPLGLAKSKIDYLPCEKTTCHHDGTPASDMFAPVGTSVFAIEEGEVDTVKDGYDGFAGCYSINFTGKSGWKYWLGHIKSPVVAPGKTVKAGDKLAVVGETKCARFTAPHLHIDRGGPEKGTPGGYDDRRSPTLIPLLNELFKEMPA